MKQRQPIRMLLNGAITLALLMSTALFATPTMNQTNLTITSSLGQIKGLVNDDIATFYALPYAKNPFTEARRFQAPEAIKSWQGVFDSTTMQPPVPQPSRGQTTELVGAPGDLTLNIWTPTAAITSAQKLPVMVWIPGGAFIREDASEAVYDGSSFARNDVVVVTINYRVGVDGFMHLPGAPDNRGILDQIAALEWVKDNIAEFGGDPDRVTLFGQSAGAESVAILLGTEKANGLYHQAIIQSPPMQAMTQTEAERVAQAFAAQLNVPATIAGIASVPFPQLVAAVTQMGNAIQNHDDWGMLSWGGTAFLPVIDRTLIEQTPMANLANNANPDIPVIVGSTAQEARLYLVPGGVIDRIEAKQTTQFLDDLKLNDSALTVYSKANTEQSEGDIYAAIQSDYTFRMPAVHIAEQLVKNGNTVWQYNFAWQSPAFGGRLGAAHFVDVPFTFNTIDRDAATDFVGDQPPAALATEIHNQWLHFAKQGNADWSTYQPNKPISMRFDIDSAEVSNPDADIRKLWQQYHF